VSPRQGLPRSPDEIRRITDVHTLRMLADPLRLAILAAFRGGGGIESLTVKELAERLDEGQSKLYRHVRRLEDAHLLEVAATRVVSGILEKRYRPTFRRLVIESDVLEPGQGADEFRDTSLAVLTSVRDRLQSDLLAGRVPLEPAEVGPDLSIQLEVVQVTMSRERYARVRGALSEIIRSEAHSDEDATAIPVVIQSLIYPQVSEASG
jgi:DNA-binding transcriptional ArsR family regulator